MYFQLIWGYFFFVASIFLNYKMDLMLSKTDLLLNQLLAERYSGVGVGDGRSHKTVPFGAKE